MTTNKSTVRKLAIPRLSNLISTIKQSILIVYIVDEQRWQALAGVGNKANTMFSYNEIYSL